MDPPLGAIDLDSFSKKFEKEIKVKKYLRLVHMEPCRKGNPPPPPGGDHKGLDYKSILQHV